MKKQDTLGNQVNYAYLALGSNLGKKIKNLELAKYMLFKNDVKIIKTSSFYSSNSWPNSKFPEFINAVLLIKTKLLLPELFKQVKLIDHVCIATSKCKEDDAIASFAASQGISLFRGSLNDVLSRAVNASIEYKYDNVLRVCGDRPFLDGSMYSKMIKIHT